jgi:hypothetical protein
MVTGMIILAIVVAIAAQAVNVNNKISMNK